MGRACRKLRTIFNDLTIFEIIGKVLVGVSSHRLVSYVMFLYRIGREAGRLEYRLVIKSLLNLRTGSIASSHELEPHTCVHERTKSSSYVKL